MAAFVLSRSPPPPPPPPPLLLLLMVALFGATLTASSVPSTSGHGAPVESPATTDGKTALYSSMAEGGSILTSQHETIEIITESNKIGEASKEDVPKERHASSSVVARKGVQDKIKPRKGVQENVTPIKSINQNMDLEKITLLNQTFKNTFKNMKPVMESNPAIETTHIKSSNISFSKLNIINSRSENLNRNINSSYSNASLILVNGTSHPEIINNMTTKISHTEKHIPKHKPTITTVDGPEINESIPQSRTKNPSLGMPRKIDYIVPVIITIVALPILGTAIFVLYRRGRDCWDKRHYRRMDFLIDGMYND